MLMQTFSKFRKMEVNMKSLKELLNFKTNKKVRIAVACPEDYEVLSAIFEAYELDMGLFSLFGNVSKIKSIAQEIGKDIPSDFLLVDFLLAQHDQVDLPACPPPPGAVRKE